MQWVLPNTGTLYLKFMKSLPDKPEIIQENLEVEGGSLHWIGPKSNKKVMIFVHGALPLTPLSYSVNSQTMKQEADL